MADKSFGVKEINLLKASGTPTIESPNNLNLKAVNVAISTDASIGGQVGIADTIFHIGDTDTKIRFPANNTITAETSGSERLRIDSVGNIGVGSETPTAKLDVSGDLKISGITTTAAVSWGGHMLPTSNALYDIGSAEFKVRHLFLSDNSLKFVDSSDTEHPLSLDSGKLKFGGGLLLGNTITADSASGIVTATSYRSSTTTGNGSDVAFAIKYYINSNGSSAYRFAGAGVLNSTDNPTLYFHRGFTYILENSTGGSHPFQLRTTSGGSAYAPGGSFLTGSTTGTQILTVPFDAPTSIVYQCTIHGGMVGSINFVL
tara:strand:- start:1147 stop:2094 length:948 start_codon:yes stop_codon:yes gene_type:complete